VGFEAYNPTWWTPVLLHPLEGALLEHSAALEVRLAAFPFAGGAEGSLSQRSIESETLTEASSIVM
jgi:hypothetical protein